LCMNDINVFSRVAINTVYIYNFFNKTFLSLILILFSSRSAVQPKQTLLHYFPVITIKLL